MSRTVTAVASHMHMHGDRGWSRELGLTAHRSVKGIGQIQTYKQFWWPWLSACIYGTPGVAAGAHSHAGEGWELGLDPGLWGQRAVGALVVGMCLCSCRGEPSACVQQWMLVMRNIFLHVL